MILALPIYVIPDDAVVGGHVDGFKQFICQVYHQGDILPARIAQDSCLAVTSFDVSEIAATEYEYIRIDNVEWVADERGHVPKNAVSGGRTVTGEELYIGRVEYLNNLIMGKIHPSHRCLYFAYHGRELNSKVYEVLVEKTAPEI